MNRQDIPSKRVLDASLRVIHEHARVDTPEATFPLQQESQVLAVRLRFDLQEAGQALLVEQAGVEGVGRGETPDRLTRSSRRTPQFQQDTAGVLPPLAHDRSAQNRRMGRPR